MPLFSPESLIQVSDFTDPSAIDVFEHEEIFDKNGFPYLAFSPHSYKPEGPQMVLGDFPSDDITGRRENCGIVNMTERRNAQEHFGDAMRLLRSIRMGYLWCNPSADTVMTNSDALRLAHMGIELPRYLLWRKDAEYKNGELPPETILLSRALRGFHGMVTKLSYGEPATVEHRREFIAQPFSAEDTAEKVIEKRGLENDLVCAAHWNMVTEMLGIIEGSKTSPKIDAADIGFFPFDLIEFSKSLRAFWDVVYPNLEYGLKAADDALQSSDPSQAESRAAEAREFMGTAVEMANMANLVISTVTGIRVVRKLELEELGDSLERYGNRGNQRQKELTEFIAIYSD